MDEEKPNGDEQEEEEEMEKPVEKEEQEETQTNPFDWMLKASRDIDRYAREGQDEALKQVRFLI